MINTIKLLKDDMLKFLLLLNAVLFVACLTVACSSIVQQSPTPFETGDVVLPPYGCTELRKQNEKADC